MSYLIFNAITVILKIDQVSENNGKMKFINSQLL